MSLRVSNSDTRRETSEIFLLEVDPSSYSTVPLWHITGITFATQLALLAELIYDKQCEANTFLHCCLGQRRRRGRPISETGEPGDAALRIAIQPQP